MMHNAEQNRVFHEIMAEDGHDNTVSVDYSLKRTFDGVNFEGARVLDVGSGRGLMTLYAAINGATKVVSMEPELDGSSDGVFEMQKERAERLGLRNVEFLAEDFNSWQNPGEKFDVILCMACINHLHEVEHNALSHKPTYDRFREIAEQFQQLLKPNGVVVFTDAARYGLFWMLKHVGIRRPWKTRKSSINWRIHQNPTVWKKIFLESGFSEGSIIYPLPYRLRWLGPLVANPISNFCLKATFAVQCRAAENRSN